MGHLIAGGLRSKHPIDAGPADPQSAGDFRGPDAFLLEPDDLVGLPSGGRHTALIRPSALALAMPSRWRSSMASRSACPTAPMTASINLPVAVPVSSGCAPGHGQHPQDDPLGFEPGDDLQQVADRPRQPVQLGHGEGVALADVIQRLFKLLTLGDRRHLLGENLIAPGGPKLALLGFQTGDLGERGCPRVSHQHGNCCLTWNYNATIPQVSNLSSNACETDFRDQWGCPMDSCFETMRRRGANGAVARSFPLATNVRLLSEQDSD